MQAIACGGPHEMNVGHQTLQDVHGFRVVSFSNDCKNGDRARKCKILRVGDHMR